MTRSFMMSGGDSEEEDEDDMQRDDRNILDFELQPIVQLSSSQQQHKA
jgi:hypothetical protein